ncbi:MAG: hypothetical protein WED34_15940 [Planctomycetales bacterium]
MSDPTLTAPDEIAAAPRGVRRAVKILFALGGAFLVGLVLFVVWREMYGPPRFTISKETTYITEPLRADGLPDYAAALDAMASEGVTPENNAAVLYWQAFGPAEVDPALRAEFFAKLGMPVPPAAGDYIVTESAFAAERDRLSAGSASAAPGGTTLDVLFEQMDRGDEPWLPADAPLLAEWIQRNEKPLALIVEGTRRTHYYRPVIAPPDDGHSPLGNDTLLAVAQHSRGVARLLSNRATQRLAEGDVEGAKDDLIACHRLARHIAQGASLIEWLVGVAIDAMARHGDTVLAQRGGLSSADATEYRERLADLPPFPPIADKFDRYERFFYLSVVLYVAHDGAEGLEFDQGALPMSLVDWDVALLEGNEFFDSLADAARAPTAADRRMRLDELDRGLRQAAKDAAMPTRLVADRSGLAADMLLANFLPGHTVAVKSGERTLMETDLVQLAFALAAYRADQGEYAPALADLAPKYIAAVPDDLFSGKPLIYRPTEDGSGYLLYSVGQNEIDDGGRWIDDDPEGDDLVVRTPTPEAGTP